MLYHYGTGCLSNCGRLVSGAVIDYYDLVDKSPGSKDYAANEALLIITGDSRDNFRLGNFIRFGHDSSPQIPAVMFFLY
jgi:hypothetical protein